MKSGILHKLCAFVFAVIALNIFISDCSIAKEKKSSPNYLSVRRSLIPVYGWASGLHNPPFDPRHFPMNQINPAVREHIHYCLDVDKARKGKYGHLVHTQVGGIWLLGFIGDSNDVRFVDDFIQDYLKLNQGARKRLFGRGWNPLELGPGCFAGMMIRRHIKGAEAFFEKYASVSAWMPPGEKETLASLKEAKELYSS
ncbi:MAG: hypothetical protein ACYSWQ_19445, partial [Planctomycetota bacterium]